jgi:hypothetical protein
MKDLWAPPGVAYRAAGSQWGGPQESGKFPSYGLNGNIEMVPAHDLEI